MSLFRRVALASTLLGGIAMPFAAQAESEVIIWPDAEPVHTSSLNGQMHLGSLSGGVGNSYGAICCSGSGGFVVVGGGVSRGGQEGDIAFRRSRDAAFGRTLGGLATDRAFRFRANSIQRSGF
ncbi:hypothetical protein [Pyruvatibacter mobilis]|uniref:hypothetical protein n=1 Tax=Pyruvatibacter mobilis TaxID=1712261 RepID=UPI003BABBF49